MVDTIVFRVVDVSQYEVCKLLLKRLMSFNAAGKITSVSQELKINVLKQREIFEEKLYRNYSGHMQLPSHTYDCFWSYNDVRNCIEFNMSVAKASFGTNVLMFLGHSPLINPFNSAVDRTYQTEKVYDNIVNFLIWFLVQAGGLNRDQISDLLSHVVLNRIDLCINQIFDSRVDAMRYIDCLKRTKKKRSRDISKDRVYDTTGVYYASDNFTIKIYHKGSEFEKNDRKELEERKVFNEDQIDALKKLADKTVRYEMEFRNKYISSIYINKIFRKNDNEFNEMLFCHTLYKRRFFEMEPKEQLIFLKKKQNSFINFDLRRSYVAKYRALWKSAVDYSKHYSDYPSDLRFFIKIVRKNSNNYQKFLNKTFSFGFVQTGAEREFSRAFSAMDKDGFIYKALFSRDLLNEMYRIFFEFVDDYDIKDSLVTVENSDTTKILQRLFDKQGFGNKRIAPYVGFYNLLQSGKSYKEIRMQKIYNTRTFERYVSFFKKLNINDKCVDVYHIRRDEPLNSYFKFVYYKNSLYIRTVINLCKFNFK